MRRGYGNGPGHSITGQRLALEWGASLVLLAQSEAAFDEIIVADGQSYEWIGVKS